MHSPFSNVFTVLTPPSQPSYALTLLPPHLKVRLAAICLSVGPQSRPQACLVYTQRDTICATSSVQRFTACSCSSAGHGLGLHVVALAAEQRPMLIYILCRLRTDYTQSNRQV